MLSEFCTSRRRVTVKVTELLSIFIEMRGEGIEKRSFGIILFSVFDIYHVFLSGVGRFLCEGFQYDCEYHFEKAWLGEAGKRLLFL